MVQDTLITLLAGGHALLVGVPGLAKTRLAETLGVVLGLAQKRVQFTPDLMPADILGSEVLDDAGTGRQSFRFIPGPIFAQLLMADEINRASPRTQAALLQAMQERKVTVAGQDHAAARAVSRPRDAEPDRAGGHLSAARGAARPVLHADQRRLPLARGRAPDDHRHHHRHARHRPQRVLDGATLMGMQRLVRRMPIGEQLIDLILRLVRAGRPENEALPGLAQQIAWGPGPRASQSLMLAVRVRALLDGRLAPSVEDVIALARPVLRHRMAVTFAARAEGIGVDDVIGRLCRHVA